MRQPLVLVGLPGCGKSTVGPLVACRLELPFVDLDARIEAAAARSIPEIFAQEGEAAFRDLERQAMRVALAEPPAVIAPGGGWAAQPGNLAAVGAAITVYLAVSPELAATRLGRGDGRPLLVGQEPAQALAALHAARDPWYRQAALTVDAGAGSPDDVADRVVAAVRQGGHHRSAAR